MILSDDFNKESEKAEGKNLDLNLDILKTQKLEDAKSLNKIISARFFTSVHLVS